MSRLLHDLRSALHDMLFALRGARRHPVFALGVVLTLGLGLGANTAIFTVVRAVLLRQLPFHAPDRLVVVHLREDGGDQPLSIQDFLDLRAAAGSLEAFVGWGSWGANLTGVDQPVRLGAQTTTAGFFDALGVHAALGRTPRPEEERAGAAKVVLVSDRLWRGQLGGDPAILGRVLTLNGEPYTVIGVLPRDFIFLGRDAELVTPLDVETDPRRANRGSAFLRVVARLRPGVTPEAATAELDAVVAHLRTAYPKSNAGKEGVRLESLAERVVGGHRRTLVALQLAVGAVLLVACANLASLFLARVVAREPELALRAALGARRGDVLRQLLAESLALALAGGALGLFLAFAAVRGLVALAPVPLPRAAEIGIDGAVVAFTLATSLAVGLAFGLLPALHGSDRGLRSGLGAGRGATGGAWSARARGALILVEVTLAVVLLVVAGLMLRSFHRVQETDPGFEPDRVLVAQLSLPRSRYGSPPAITRYGEELAGRLRALPGVSAAGVASVSPLVSWRATVSMTIEGRAEPTRDQAPTLNYRAVGPGYFATLGIPLLEGRDVDDGDRADSRLVALISSTLARRHFPGVSPLGARLVIDDVPSWRIVEVIGVVGDVKHTGLEAEDTADLYVPYPQTPPGISVWLANLLCVVVRTEAEPQALAADVRAAIRALDGDVAVTLRSMDEAIAASLAGRRFNTRLLQAFGAVALALALAGIYAVTAMTVAERSRELAVRMSLGAGRRRILGAVVGRALLPVGLGLAAGVAAALALGRVVGALLFGVSPHDGATLATVTITLALTAVVASLGPALRATRIDPVSVLRG